MNKKGFTLVELLAVVVIMGILALIAIPNVTRLLNNSKNKQMISDAEILISKAKYEYKMSDDMENIFNFNDYLEDKKDGYNDLYTDGNVIYDEIVNAYKVSLMTSRHCLSNSVDGECEYVFESNLNNSYVVERN